MRLVIGGPASKEVMATSPRRSVRLESGQAYREQSPTLPPFDGPDPLSDSVPSFTELEIGCGKFLPSTRNLKQAGTVAQCDITNTVAYEIAPTAPMSRTMANDGFSDDEQWTRAIGDGLTLRATERPDSQLLDHFFAGYDRAFVLPDERETVEGFRACLAINPASRHRFGRVHRELVMTVDDAEGVLLGGANFLATCIGENVAGHPPVAVALNYVFVEPASRGRGLARRLRDEVGRLANIAVCAPAQAPPPALFIEQNDPLRLTDTEYAADTAHAGIDQVDRLAIWARLGAQLIDFAYVQPALSADQDSDDGLAYAVMNVRGDGLDPAYLRAHLESFFGISVMKGGEPEADPVAGAQLHALETRLYPVKLLPMLPAVEALRSVPARPQGISLRAFARALT
ncbi:hypothetical protein [Novosphingobium sp. JCM 18896]|uniref:hypothetical protein n=1 Tax=Novosphingobium sp. JCM 18896 TaxID=2989731 RepID=UPI0022232D87|nr:hypothetical protein [Novosphingobium sp. JCM 18896]MCW1432091.1 hypothetical protein [Novosphingobium sp. JCM 18896]